MSPIRNTIEPIPGSEASRPATTRRSVGTAVISRNTRRMRSARSTLIVSVAGTSAMPTTMKSNTLQGSRKKAQRCTMMRAAISITNIRQDDVVEEIEQAPEPGHHGLVGLQTQDDRVDDDDRHDHALGARIVDDGAESVHDGVPPGGDRPDGNGRGADFKGRRGACRGGRRT